MKTKVYFKPTAQYRWVVELRNGDFAFFWEWENALHFALTKPIIDEDELDARLEERITRLLYNNPTKVKR